MVLVVENDADAREVLCRVFETAAAEAIAVASAAEALDTISQQLPDVIVSDIAMPGGDGYQLIRTLRAQPADRGGRTPAIALTAFASEADRARALHAGFDAHFAKPVESDLLLARIAALLGRAVASQDKPD
jgi:CheY-like chemotaxis protein